jgi:hypothetical protein
MGYAFCLRILPTYKTKDPGRMSSNAPIKLRIPRQDLQVFDLFPLDGHAASSWAQSLPVANTGAVVSQLRHALHDLNRVGLPVETRFQILQALRPSLEVALTNLSRRFLNQPLVMPEVPRQLAEQADELLGLACTAYTVAATEAIRDREAIRETNPARLVCESLLRAVEFAGKRILQTFQLYRPVELHGWLELNQLYALAESQQLEKLPVAEGRTIAAAYLQALMLGCSKPNQLRQSDQAAIFRGLRDWAKFIQILIPGSGTGLFLVDLDSDQPPLYASLHEGHPQARYRLVDTGPLVEHLRQLRVEDDRQGKRGIAFDHDTTLPSNILDHLLASLGEASTRNFGRSQTDRPLWVGIGLSCTHYLLAGEKRFEHLLYGDNYVPPAHQRVVTNPFMEEHERRDLWHQANPEEDFTEDEGAEQADERLAEMTHKVQVDEKTLAVLEDDDDAVMMPEISYPVYEVHTVNASPGGYCVEWSEHLPGDIRTGDILAVRESPDKGWAVAVIRWVSQLENARTLIGLELLSPRAMPYGAMIHQKKGGTSDPVRVLLLPEIKLVGQPHTLVVPRAGFREGQKITLIRAGEKFYIQLQRQVAATGSFAQFDFRYIKLLSEVLAEDKSAPPGSPYDSLWSKI